MHEQSSSKWKDWFTNCICCRQCCHYLWELCCCCFIDKQRTPPARKEDITYILQQNNDETASDLYSDQGERHGSFTSASASIGSYSSGGGGGGGGGGSSNCGGGGRDLKAEIYNQIEARRASSSTMRKESTPLIDLKSIDFWSGGSRDPTLVQPKLLLSPGRRDTIGSQGSADQIRPDLYEDHMTAEASGEEVAGTTVYESLGTIHFYLGYDVPSKSLNVRIIEARDLPRPIALDSAKQDQAHSNPYVKICLLPNQKDSRQSSLRKKTQNPRFDENFSFELPFRELQRRTLQLLIKDFDKYSRHRVIGQVLLPFAESSLNLVKGDHLWRPLEPVHAISQEDLGEILFSLCYLPAAGRLNVDILRAKQLLPTDLVGGAAPYVRVSLIINERHVKTKKTSYKKYTLDPVFNESLSFDVNSVQLQDCAVVLSVLDFNGGVLKDNFIGRIVLGREASGPHEVNHWKNMIQSKRTPVAQWHSLKSRSHCDETCSASRAAS